MKNNFVLTFNDNTEVFESTDEEETIPNIKYKFSSIANIAKIERDTLIDVRE